MTKLEEVTRERDVAVDRSHKLQGENAALQTKVNSMETKSEQSRLEVSLERIERCKLEGKLSMLQSIFDRLMRSMKIDDMVRQPINTEWALKEAPPEDWKPGRMG